MLQNVVIMFSNTPLIVPSRPSIAKRLMFLGLFLKSGHWSQSVTSHVSEPLQEVDLAEFFVVPFPVLWSVSLLGCTAVLSYRCSASLSALVFKTPRKERGLFWPLLAASFLLVNYLWSLLY
jgi:hypothetical protein